MFELLLQKIKEHVVITDEEFDFCKTLFIPKKLRKRQYLLQEGDQCKYVAFVEKGLLRSYSIDETGFGGQRLEEYIVHRGSNVDKLHSSCKLLLYN